MTLRIQNINLLLLYSRSVFRLTNVSYDRSPTKQI